MKYPLWFFVSFVHPVTQQYEPRTGLKAPQVATMKNMDDFHYAKEAIMYNYQINAFHCQQRHKAGHW